jgi:thiol-disulfide isomerase/thioredoxin
MSHRMGVGIVTRASSACYRVIPWRLKHDLRVAVFSMVCGVCALSGCFSNGERFQALVGKPLPDARLIMLDGSHHALKSQVGRAMAFLFWSTSCSFSRGAIERFNELAETYKERTDLRFLAVSVDAESAIGDLESRIREQDLQVVEHVFSGNEGQDEVYLAFNGERIPYVVFVDERGIVRLAQMGLHGLEQLLAERYSVPN